MSSSTGVFFFRGSFCPLLFLLLLLLLNIPMRKGVGASRNPDLLAGSAGITECCQDKKGERRASRPSKNREMSLWKRNKLRIKMLAVGSG
jgi:hypothetical protein